MRVHEIHMLVKIMHGLGGNCFAKVCILQEVPVNFHEDLIAVEMNLRLGNEKSRETEMSKCAHPLSFVHPTLFSAVPCH